MRNRWEDSKGGLDDPVTLTERQLRSLKRGARAGLFALLLAFAAVGVVGWSSVEDGKLSILSAALSPTRNHASQATTGPGAGAAPDTARGIGATAPTGQPAIQDSAAARH